MLAADKLLLRSTVKQRAIQLREKELLLFTDNFNAVGTQSAVLAGFAMTSFAEIDLPHNAFYAQKVCTDTLRPLLSPGRAGGARGGWGARLRFTVSPRLPWQACLHLFVTISICANLMCTASTTFGNYRPPPRLPPRLPPRPLSVRLGSKFAPQCPCGARARLSAARTARWTRRSTACTTSEHSSSRALALALSPRCSPSCLPVRDTHGPSHLAIRLTSHWISRSNTSRVLLSLVAQPGS